MRMGKTAFYSFGNYYTNKAIGKNGRKLFPSIPSSSGITIKTLPTPPHP